MLIWELFYGFQLTIKITEIRILIVSDTACSFYTAEQISL